MDSFRKKVYLEPPGKLHSYFRTLLSHPPEGYEFVLNNSAWDASVAGPMMSNDFIYYTLQRKVIEPLLPIHLVKAYLEKFFKRPPVGTVLTYSYGHPIFRHEPWVVELEWVNQLVGYNAAHLPRYKGVLERAFESAECKAVLCWSELCRNGLLNALDCEKFAHKIHLVLHAVPPKNFVKTVDDSRVKLFFVGSSNIPGEFHLKGGKEVLESFRILCARYQNLELVIRSDIPPEIKEQYSGMPGVRFIEEALPWPDLEREFQTADIFLFPGHHTPFMVLLDALSYGLPVVTTNAYANGELVEDGVTGFVVPASDQVPYYVRESIPDGRSRSFVAATERLDARVVQDIVARTSMLIEDRELRERMGQAARWEVEHGRFSIKRRNECLKRIFDEAIGDSA